MRLCRVILSFFSLTISYSKLEPKTLYEDVFGLSYRTLMQIFWLFWPGDSFGYFLKNWVIFSNLFLSPCVYKPNDRVIPYVVYQSVSLQSYSHSTAPTIVGSSQPTFYPGNTVPLTSCLTGLDQTVLQIKQKLSVVIQLIPNQSNRRSTVQ